MVRATDIRSREKSLGFKWERTVSRAKDCQKYPIIKELNAELKRITESYQGLRQIELLESTELEKEANVLFDDLGPKLWPADGDVNHVRSQWLAVSAVDNLAGFYPHDLYFEQTDHNERLRIVFYEWVVAKSMQYVRNHKPNHINHVILQDDPTLATEDQLGITALCTNLDDRNHTAKSRERTSLFSLNDAKEDTGIGDRRDSM
ncbi:hypothetical protein LTR78_010875 [Recurvomyces mirabilis]|uniref:Uncharacterized protein n=1 Tax=Recurvomyces mirabilis TaxID=574656 RepID=A0AAE0TLK7_9PEZI|nr:hypothetical protein LTR78_010875 [Recurvomyces mirabilis]KAK5149889.1 hypothetical protein LTS14_010604 [Recurvomyces mirabilis]